MRDLGRHNALHGHPQLLLDGVGIPRARIEHGKRGVARADGGAFDDPHVGSFIQARRLPFGEDDSPVVREHEDHLGVHLVKGGDEILRGGVHALAPVHDHVGTALTEGVLQSFTAGDGHDSVGLTRLGGSFFVFFGHGTVVL